MEPVAIERFRVSIGSPLLFDMLPEELILVVLSLLDARSLLLSAQTCKEWNALFSRHQAYLWKQLLIGHWPTLGSTVAHLISSFGCPDQQLKNLYFTREKWFNAISKLTMDTTNSFWKLSNTDPSGLLVEYKPVVRSDGQAMKSTAPWPKFTMYSAKGKSIEVHYYEVEIIDAGPTKSMGIGFACKDTPLGTIPGWNRGGGYTAGYHADNGLKYWRMGSGKNYGDTYQNGDVIGCGFDRTTQSIFFTKNGSFVGVAFSSIPKLDYYPFCGSLETCLLRFNFGKKPFKYNIDKLYS